TACRGRATSRTDSRARKWAGRSGRDLTSSLRNEGEGDVDDHVFLAADQAALAALGEDVAYVEVVAGCGGLGVTQERGVHPGIPEGQGLPVHPHRTVLQRPHDVIGGVLQREQVTTVLEPRQVRHRDERL